MAGLCAFVQISYLESKLTLSIQLTENCRKQYYISSQNKLPQLTLKLKMQKFANAFGIINDICFASLKWKLSKSKHEHFPQWA